MKLIILILHWCRSSYQQYKKVAATSKKIFAGQEVAPLRTVSNDMALWMITLGEGFGKRQYRSLTRVESRQFVSGYLTQLVKLSNLWQFFQVWCYFVAIFSSLMFLFSNFFKCDASLEQLIQVLASFGYFFSLIFSSFSNFQCFKTDTTGKT